MQPIQLAIPTPCHEDWNKMTPNQQGRFCGSCAKTVVDFSAMTDAQLLFYFENLKNENVCGRVYPDQLNRPIEKAAPVAPRKKIFWLWQYAAALVFFFTKGTLAKAQGEIRGKVVQKADTLNIPEPIRLGGIRRVTPEDIGVIPNTIISQLFITDENGEPIAGASVQLLPSKKWMTTDSSGKINFGIIHAIKEVKISAIGYERKSIKLKDVQGNSVSLTKNILTLGEVAIQCDTGIQGNLVQIAGGISVLRSEDIKEVTPVIETPVSAGVSFSMFPNPVQKGKEISFTVTSNKKKECKIFIADASGKMMMQQDIAATVKAQQININIPALWSSGVYIISLVDKSGTTIQAEKIVLL